MLKQIASIQIDLRKDPNEYLISQIKDIEYTVVLVGQTIHHNQYIIAKEEQDK